MLKRMIAGACLLCLWIIPAQIMARDAVGWAYISDDGQFSFTYPDALTVRVNGSPLSLTTGDFFIAADEPIRVEVSPPMSAAQLRMAGIEPDPLAVVEARMNLWRQIAPSRIAELFQYARRSTEPEAVFAEYLAADGRTIAYAEQTLPIDAQHSAAVIIMAVDVGSNHMVIITASPSLLDGANLLAAHRDDVFALAESLAFTPALVVSIENALALSSDYADAIGTIQTGDLSFSYPKDWYIFALGGNVFVTNTDRIVSHDVPLTAGMLQTMLIPPDYNMAATFGRSAVADCAVSAADRATMTPLSVLQSEMLNADRLASYDEQGATYHEPEQIELDGREAAYMRLFTPERDVLVVAVNVGDDYVMSMMAFAAVGEMAEFDDTIFALVTTLEYTHDGC